MTPVVLGWDAGCMLLRYAVLRRLFRIPMLAKGRHALFQMKDYQLLVEYFKR